jgi:hypothetical protein
MPTLPEYVPSASPVASLRKDTSMTHPLSAAQSPVEVSHTGDLLVSAGFVVAVLVLTLFVVVVWLFLKVLADTWRLLLLVAAVVFVTCWLPVQCDTDAILDRSYNAHS